MVQTNTLFVQRPVSDILLLFDLITKLKINMFGIIMESLHIHEHVSSFKSFTSYFYAIISPKCSNMWEMKNISCHWYINIIIIVLMVVLINTIYFILWNFPIASSFSIVWHKSHLDVTSSGILMWTVKQPNSLYIWYLMFGI